MNPNEIKKPFDRPIASAIKQYYSNRKNQTLNDKLESLGWEEFDAGASSTVYINPQKNYVVKMNNYTDPEFDFFAQLTKKHPNKHFPKISNRRGFSENGGRGTTYYIYLIEKLYKLPYKFSENFAEDCDYIAGEYFWNDEPVGGEALSTASRATKQAFKEQPGLLKALKILAFTEKRLDMHAGNIMQRKNGTIVFIDPFC